MLKTWRALVGGIFGPKWLPKPLRNDLLISIGTFLAFETVSGSKLVHFFTILCQFEIQKSFIFIGHVEVFMVLILLPCYALYFCIFTKFCSF